MRWFEIALILSSTCLLWRMIWFRNPPSKAMARGSLILMAVVSLIHLILEGGRWQMGPAYLTALLAGIGYGAQTFGAAAPARWRGRLKAVFLSLGAFPLSASAICLPYFLPVFTIEAPTGAYPVGTVSYTWADAARTDRDGTIRTLNVQVWYPSEKGRSGHKAAYISNLPAFSRAIQEQYGIPRSLLRYLDRVETHAYLDVPFASEVKESPLIFVSHGNMLGARFTSNFQTVELASHGYVVVAVEHPGTALLSAYPDGTYVPYTDTVSHLPMEYLLHNEASIPAIREQTTDIEFVLEKVRALIEPGAPSPLAGKVDLSKMGIIGHSLGGATAVDVLYRNPAFLAAINMDGYLYGESRDTPLDRPALLMTGGLEVESGSEFEAMKRTEEQRREFILAGRGCRLDIERASHLDFTDFPLYSPLLKSISPDVKRNHRLINESTLCFLDRYLRGNENAACRDLGPEQVGPHNAGQNQQGSGDMVQSDLLSQNQGSRHDGDHRRQIGKYAHPGSLHPG